MSNIFDTLALLFTKADLPPGFRPPSWLVVGRFLASELDFAPLAKGIALEVRDDEVAWAMWRAALPKWRRAPRLNYIAPKKEHDDELVAALAACFALSPQDSREALDTIDAGGGLPALRGFLGLEAKANRG